MKIKDFDEKVRIGSQISFNGMVYAVVDIDRRTHEAIVGKAAIRIRCSEFELYTGGEVPCYVEEKDPPFKLGRPGKPVVAIFQNGKRKVFTSLRSFRGFGNIPSHDQESSSRRKHASRWNPF